MNSVVGATSVVNAGFQAVRDVGKGDLVLGVEHHLLAAVARVPDDEVLLEQFTLLQVSL